MKYSIVIPTYNHCDDFLKPCIDSILKYSYMPDVEIVVSANGCTDNTGDYLKLLLDHFTSIGLPNNLKIVWNEHAIGYPKATNEGIKVCSGERIVLLNNDCVLLEQEFNTWLNLLNAPFEHNQKCGITCVVKEYSKILKRDFAIFFCVMIDRKVFDTIGFLDEEFGIGSGEDIDFCFRAEESGFEVLEVLEKVPLPEKYYTGKFPIYHYAEGTVHDETLVKNWKSTFAKNSIKVALKFSDDWQNVNLLSGKKVGVITPIYNDVERVFKCLSTVKSQTFKNLIHFIYDDASQDGLTEALSDLIGVDPRINFFRGEINMGQSHARNFLLKKAIQSGCDYVAFLDSDDSWKIDHLENSLKYLNDADIVYSKPFFVDDKFNPLVEVNIPTPNVFVGKQLLHNNFIWISSVVAKTNCFLNHSFDNTLDSIEDWDMWIKLWQDNFKFVDKNDKTCFYLCRENSQASIGKNKLPILKQKYNLLDKLKLHLACGHDYCEDYINVDLYAPEDAKCDVRFDVQKLPYPDNSVDEIRAFHIIEHFHFFEIKEVLNEWYRVLKPGGRLWLETPDFLETCRSFVEGSPSVPIQEWRVLLYGHFFAHPWVPGQTHKFLFTEDQLKTNLEWAGFKNTKRLPPSSGYVMDHTVHLFLNVETFK